ncbi:ABC transporter ATP-binding protein [Schinkia sp. CFF1]
MINMNGISKTFGKKKVLKDVTLQIRHGEVFGLLGPNGAGKSTLLSILATIHNPSSGSVTINGLLLEKDKKKIRKLIGYVPQDVALLAELTVKDNLLFWSKFSNVSISKEYLFELCSVMQLTDKWNEKVSHLSGGMKRKLNIITALIHNPSILLMDEPTVGIDIESKMEINNFIGKLAEQGKTIVYITHDMSEIIHTCNRFAVMKEGAVHFIGTLTEAKDLLIKQGLMINDAEEIVYFLLKKDAFNTIG